MMDTSRERLIPLRQLPTPAIAGREDKPLKTSTLRSWCTVGLRGIRLESLKIQGRHYTSMEALSRFSQAVTAATAARTTCGRTPIDVGTQTHREQAQTLPDDVARLRTKCKGRGENGSNGQPFRSGLPRFSSAMLKAVALERLARWQVRVLLDLESRTGGKAPGISLQRSLAELAAIYDRWIYEATPHLRDQLRDEDEVRS